MEYDVMVIGGGPAGMMAAGRAAQCGAKTILVEKNKALGKKLLITGNGRCNITNAEPDVKRFLNGFGKNGKFLLPAFKTFSNNDIVKFFNDHGLDTKLESRQYVFPSSDNAQDVLDVLIRFLKDQGVTIACDTRVDKFVLEGRTVQVETAQGVTAERYILCTGGLSYPGTGSTGEGMEWAKSIGHNIIPPRGALVHMNTNDQWISNLKGLSLQNVDISAFQDGKKRQGDKGDMLFTDTGITGPAIIRMSKDVGILLENDDVELRIDLKPEIEFPQLDKIVQKELQTHSKKELKNVLASILPARLIDIILSTTGLDAYKNAGNVTKEERKLFIRNVKQFVICISSIGSIETAIVTAGGVDIKEISYSTMRSRIVENLFFAGEVMDIDGPTGGYNLQAAWSTGYLAGESAAEQD